MFSLCLAGNGGVMTVGKVNQELHMSNESVRTKYSTQRNLYSLEGVGNIRAGKSVIHNKGEKLGVFGVFIDSGSTFTYFPRQNFLTFKN